MRLLNRVKKQRQNRNFRVGNRVRGSAVRPRLTVFRSNKHIFAQIVDDQLGRTLVAANSQQESVGPLPTNRGNAATASVVGRTIAIRALAIGVKKVAFDRGSYRFHGRVAALANAAREGGLEF